MNSINSQNQILDIQVLTTIAHLARRLYVITGNPLFLNSAMTLEQLVTAAQKADTFNPADRDALAKIADQALANAFSSVPSGLSLPFEQNDRDAVKAFSIALCETRKAEPSKYNSYADIERKLDTVAGAEGSTSFGWPSIVLSSMRCAQAQIQQGWTVQLVQMRKLEKGIGLDARQDVTHKTTSVRKTAVAAGVAGSVAASHVAPKGESYEGEDFAKYDPSAAIAAERAEKGAQRA